MLKIKKYKKPFKENVNIQKELKKCNIGIKNLNYIKN